MTSILLAFLHSPHTPRTPLTSLLDFFLFCWLLLSLCSALFCFFLLFCIFPRFLPGTFCYALSLEKANFLALLLSTPFGELQLVFFRADSSRFLYPGTRCFSPLYSTFLNLYEYWFLFVVTFKKSVRPLELGPTNFVHGISLLVFCPPPRTSLHDPLVVNVSSFSF